MDFSTVQRNETAYLRGAIIQCPFSMTKEQNGCRWAIELTKTSRLIILLVQNFMWASVKKGVARIETINLRINGVDEAVVSHCVWLWLSNLTHPSSEEVSLPIQFVLGNSK
jgi:hypothetical protein